jgi:hypothetical protein
LFDYTATEQLSSYTGTGNFTVGIKGNGVESSGKDGGINESNTIYFGDYLELIYDYTPGSPVPEPSALILLGAGLAGLGVAAKFRKGITT